MGKYNDYLDVEVQRKAMKDGERSILEFWNINRSDFAAILDRILEPGKGPFRKALPDKNIEKAWVDGSVLKVIVRNDKADDFIDSGLKSIQSALVKSGKYDTEAIMNLSDEVWHRLNFPSKEQMNKDFDESRASEIAAWTNYLNTINDPATVEALKLYSEMYGESIYGHALSLRNVMSIKRKNPDATYVLGRGEWSKYGRGVRRNAQLYPLWGMKTNYHPTAEDIEVAKKFFGFEGEDFGNLGVAVRNGIEIEASKKKGIMMPFRYYGVDIADTYLYKNAKEDPLLAKPNISSNLSYRLNRLAQEAEAKKGGDKKKDIPGYDEMVDKTQKALSALEPFCTKYKVPMPDAQNSAADFALVESLLAIYKAAITKKGDVLKDTNIQKMAEDCTQITLIMDGVALNQLSRFQHDNVYTQKEIAAIYPVIAKVVNTLGSAMASTMTEGVLNEDSFLNRFKSALKQLGIKIVRNKEEEAPADEEENTQTIEVESIKKKFNSIMERMEKSDIAKPTRLC